MFEEFPTKLKNINDVNIIFDVDLKTKEEKILYYKSVLENQQNEEKKEYILGILNELITGDEYE